MQKWNGTTGVRPINNNTTTTNTSHPTSAAYERRSLPVMCLESGVKARQTPTNQNATSYDRQPRVVVIDGEETQEAHKEDVDGDTN